MTDAQLLRKGEEIAARQKVLGAWDTLDLATAFLTFVCWNVPVVYDDAGEPELDDEAIMDFVEQVILLYAGFLRNGGQVDIDRVTT